MTITTDEPKIVEFPALKDARAKLNAKQAELAGVLKEAAENDYDMSKVKSLKGDSDEKVAWIQEAEKSAGDLHAEYQKLMVVARAAGSAAAYEGARESGADEGHEGEPRAKGRERHSLAQAFIKSDAFKGFKAGMGQGPTATIEIPLKNLFSTGNWAPEEVRDPRIEMMPTRPAPDVADYWPQYPTSQTAIRYMEETTFTNPAAETAQGTQYPEAQLELTERVRPVEKIAVYLPVTDELFEDVEQAEAYVGSRLPFMVRQRLDGQLLAGSGTAPSLLGTENVSGIQSQALGADPIPDAIYKGMRKVRDDGFAEPNIVFIRAAKWEAVRLLKTADGVYIWGSPSQAGPMTIWGVPVKETNAAPATKAILGDYATYSGLYIKRGIDIQVSNSHADFFINGKLAVRADVRVAAVHYRPKAFAQVTGL